jgi:hypothetical protein
MSINSLGLANSHLGYELNNIKKSGVDKSQNTTKGENTKVTIEEYLKELKSDYPNVNINVGNISTSNGDKYAFSGKGIHNIAVSKQYFDKVINNLEKRKEFKECIQNTINAQNWMESMCKADGRKLVATGIIIDSDGNMRSWSHTQRSSSGQDNKFSIDSFDLKKKSYLERNSYEGDTAYKKRKKENRLRYEENFLKRRDELKITNKKLREIKNSNQLVQRKVDIYENNNPISEKNNDFKCNA